MRHLLLVVVAVVLAGCKVTIDDRHRHDPPRREDPPGRRDDHPGRGRDHAAPPARPDYADQPHHWCYYPDEALYYCDRHQHHWVKQGGEWRHVERYDARPNYAAIILANEGEFEIHLRWSEHSRRHPPGSRRR